MNDLSFYLRSAHDFVEGSQSVERLTAYYDAHKDQAESLWKGLFEAADKPHEFDEFCSLIVTYGLYLQNETPRVDPLERGKFHPVQFSMRVYPYGNHRVAVLKSEYLPS